MNRYHPVLVAIHWIMVWLIFGSLFGGWFIIAATPNSDPAKLDLLMYHMAFGMGILGLMLLRALIRWRSTPLAPLPGQTPLAESAARWGHAAMYAMVILMAISGMTMTIVARLNDIVFARNGDPLPPTLEIYPSRMIHGWLAILFALLISGHIAMALYHRFRKGEPVFRRIWFGRRQAATRP